MHTVFIAYLALTLFIAWWYSRGSRSHESYVLGGKRFSGTALAIFLALTMEDTVYSLVSYAWSGIGSSFRSGHIVNRGYNAPNGQWLSDRTPS